MFGRISRFFVEEVFYVNNNLEDNLDFYEY